MPQKFNLTETFEQIDGHRYRVVRDEQGNVREQIGADPSPPISERPIKAKIKALLTADVPLTPAQRDRLLQLIAAKLIDLSDL